jgi:signal transduction histidine kinase
LIVNEIVKRLCVKKGENTEGVTIKITDIGTGIKAEEIPHLFTRFFQSKDNPIGGTGIGLSLAKSLVELHKGTITAESTPHVQTCFTVTLPVAYATATEADRLEAQNTDRIC